MLRTAPTDMFCNRLLSFQWVLIMSFFTASSSAYAKLPDKTLIYCSEGNPSGFDASQYWSVLDRTASARTIYNRLLETDGRRIRPSLATDWNVSSNGRVYTFHLRRGVKFHITPWFKPTRDFNVEDEKCRPGHSTKHSSLLQDWAESCGRLSQGAGYRSSLHLQYGQAQTNTDLHRSLMDCLLNNRSASYPVTSHMHCLTP